MDTKYQPATRASPDILYYGCNRQPEVGCLVMAISAAVFGPLVLAAILVAGFTVVEFFKSAIG